MFIKLDENMNLVITVNDTIYRGDNLCRKVIYLVPTSVGEIDVASANVYLSYIRADGTPDIVILERMEEKYKDTYYQYTLPVDCKLTKYAGEVCAWLQIFSGSPSNPTIAKSGECVIFIHESKNMDDYLCDHQLTALYQLHKAKADNIVYDTDGNYVQLTSDGVPIGDKIDMEIVAADINDGSIDFDDDPDKPEDPGSEGGSNGDSSSDGADNGDEDDVIYF